MRLNIKKLEQAGFIVTIGKDSIDITPNGGGSNTDYWLLVRTITVKAGVTDPGLQDYVSGTAAMAIERALIMQAAE